MALAFLWKKQHLWPFSVLESDDLRVSYELVQKLPIPEDTKKFVYAVREPETKSVIYILCVQDFSERSARDAELLIREIKPDAVIVKEDVSNLKDLQVQERRLSVENPVPVSSFEVIKRCFKEELRAETYKRLAQTSVLHEIFGVGSSGQWSVAKRAAQHVGSSLMLLGTPLILSHWSATSGDSDGKRNGMSRFQDLASSLVPQKVQCGWSCLSEVESNLPEVNQPAQCSFEVPQFVQSIDPFFVTIHDKLVHVFPSLGTALDHVRKIYDRVNRGEAVDALVVSEVYPFRRVVELLRCIDNDEGRLPINRMNTILSRIEFSELALEDKKHALSAQALRSLTKRFKTIVAVVDAKDLQGLRKYWYTPIPPEYKDLAAQIVTRYEGEAARPVLQGSSFSELVQASIIMNVKAKVRIPTPSDFVIRAAENTSWWAMRTAFYEMMRDGKVHPLPLRRLVVSMSIRMKLFWHKVGIKCAADSLPAAPSVARLGRGIKSLSHAAQVVKYTHESLGYRPTSVVQ
ncbi:hypothetical protein ABKV19_024379 [Rosa sericea]